MLQISFPHAEALPEDVTVTCVPSIANWRASATFDDNDYCDESVGQFNAAFDKRFRLKIPKGTLVQKDFSCSKPDVYCYTVVLPEHELAGDNGYFGIVLREASAAKIRKVIWEAEVAKREEEAREPATRRRHIVVPDGAEMDDYEEAQDASSDRLAEVMANLSAQLIEAAPDFDEKRRDEAVMEIGD
jgi:hypothetical protein